MKHAISKTATAALFVSALLGTAHAVSAETAKPAIPVILVASHDDVYIDPPTGFAFVQTPAGWKFIRKIDEKSYQDYKDSVVTEKLAARGK